MGCCRGLKTGSENGVNVPRACKMGPLQEVGIQRVRLEHPVSAQARRRENLALNCHPIAAATAYHERKASP